MSLWTYPALISAFVEKRWLEFGQLILCAGWTGRQSSMRGACSPGSLSRCEFVTLLFSLQGTWELCGKQVCGLLLEFAA